MALDNAFFSKLAKIPMDVFDGVSVTVTIVKVSDTYDATTGDAVSNSSNFTARGFKLKDNKRRGNSSGTTKGSLPKKTEFRLLFRTAELAKDIEQSDVIKLGTLEYTIVDAGIDKDPAGATTTITVSGAK